MNGGVGGTDGGKCRLFIISELNSFAHFKCSAHSGKRSLIDRKWDADLLIVHFDNTSEKA